jgi:hypothetical protein
MTRNKRGFGHEWLIAQRVSGSRDVIGCRSSFAKVTRRDLHTRTFEVATECRDLRCEGRGRRLDIVDE